MKRVLFVLTAFIISSGALLTSCSSDNSTNPDQPPTIDFVAGSGFISQDATLTVDTPFSVKIVMESNATSGSKLQSLKVTRVFNLQSTDTTYTFNETTLTVTIQFTARSLAGEEGIEFKVTDKAGQSATINLKITTEEGQSGAISSWTEKVLGSWNNTTGSSFASFNGNVYTLDQAFANQSLIDYMYWWGQNTSATIGAPNDENARLVFNTGDYKLDNWQTKNATLFKETSVTSAEFDAIQYGTELISAATGANLSRIETLEANQVIAFKTVTDKYGLIRVKAIETGSDGTITIDVKVEQ